MEDYSILVGKSYRTPDGEVRFVKAMDRGEVEYAAVSGPHGPGMIAHAPAKRLPLAQFAAGAGGEVSSA
jgi:hypothetical protein